jgi:hypothetical protein
MDNFRAELTLGQTSRLDLIDQGLSQSNECAWSNRAVTNSAKWRNIRYLATKALGEFGGARGATTTRQ